MELKSRLVIRAIRLNVKTDEGEVGRTILLQRGLNILRAGNTSGKSTTVQAIIYALGLEGMLSSKREVPLPHSMTDRVTVDGNDQMVVSSSVSLEFENAEGKIVTVTRQVKAEKARYVDNAVISVVFGPTITGSGDFAVSDYFVRRSGAAQRENGFHFFLSDFLGWKLPRVTYMDGSEKPLYSECLFPFFYVEQKHGWSGLPPRIPTYFGIQDVGRRAFEYVLDLEVFHRILTRQRLKSNVTEIEVAWKAALSELRSIARSAGVTLHGEPQGISDTLSDSSLSFIVSVAGIWLPIDEAAISLRELQAERGRQPVPTAEEESSQLEEELQQTEDAVRSTLVQLSLAMEERSVLQDQKHHLDMRLEALEEDLQRHKDSALLVRLGAKHVGSLAVDHVCPTCRQGVDDGFDISNHVMTIDENIDFIDRQRKTFLEAKQDASRALEAINIRERSLRATLGRLRRQVREAKDTLVGPSNAPSLADVSERVALRDQLDRLVENHTSLENQKKVLQDLAQRHEQQLDMLKTLAKSELSESDKTKIIAVEKHLRRQLTRYGFDSLPPADVAISRQTYRPSHEGYELGFDLSASDMIRVIWSYLFSVIQVAEELGGNHLGLLILDEPKQQETAQDSYRQLLHEAADQGRRGSQIIIATSEEVDSLKEMLGSTGYNLINIPSGEKVLVSLSPL